MITGQDRQLWRLFAVPALVAAVLLTVVASVVGLLGMPDSGLLWTVAALAGIAPLTVWTAEDFAGRRVGGSLFAIMVVAAAVAVGQHEVGAVAAMLACVGRALEAFVWRRARRELTALAQARTGRAINTGECVRVPTGEAVPVDGRLLADAVLDESPLSGEPMAVLRHQGEPVRSGSINAGEPFELLATVPSGESTWPAMCAVARRAIHEGAGQLLRANRAALVYLPLVVLTAFVVWLLTRDSLVAFGVLAVASASPLLLAKTLAMTAGLSRAARQKVVVGDGGVLAELARCRVAVIDSAGVVTSESLVVTEVVAAPGWLTGDVLAAAASVQRYRPDPFAGAVARAAKAAGIQERSTGGKVAFGEESPADWAKVALARAALDGASTAWVHVDGKPVGVLLVRDEIRPDAAESLRRVRSAGLRRLVLVTRNNLNDPADVGALLGVDELWTGCGTADKIERVREERRRGSTLMVGDDPAVGAADVGVALSGRGACVADAIIADGQVERLADTLRTARRARWIGVIAAGSGMSAVLAAMALVVLGGLAPLLAVLVKTVVDVLVMGVALRAAAPGRRRDEMPEHDHLRPVRLAVRQAADDLSTGLTPQAQLSVLKAYHLMADHLVPLQRAGEIERQVRRLGAHLATPNAQVEDLRATMYGLNAVLSERLISHPASLQRLQYPR
ncbi:MAG: HAD-IC family P-type ATPase [Kibdelosporangium sp.]